jgi:TolB-like protein
VSDLRRLVREIHRRSIWQVLSIYLVSGWIAYEVIESLTDGLGLPSWLPGAAVVLLIAGLPIVLATAIVQEGPPGVEGEETPRAGMLTWRNASIGAGAAALLLAAIVGGWLLLADPGDAAPPAHAATSPGDRPLDPAHVAVLYFDDLSADGSLSYLADGFTEALIHELSQVERLRVMSRNAVRPYRSGDTPLDSVARMLSVGTLVEGSVERAGDVLRATVQLIDGATNAHLMSTRLERSGEDVLALRDEIVREAAALLRRRLGEEIRLRETEREAENAESWALVQRAGGLMADAVDFARDGEIAAALRAIDGADSLLVAAESPAPDWTTPIVMRARTALMRSAWSGGRDPAPLDTARAHAERALGLAPGDPAALHMVGLERFSRLALLDSPVEAPPYFAAAERAFRAALRADPDRADTWAVLSQLLQASGRFAEAYQAAENALESDPFLAEADRILASLCGTALERAGPAGEGAADVRRHCDEAYRRFPDDPDIVYLQYWALSLDPTPDVDSAWRIVDTHVASVPATERGTTRSEGQMIVAGFLAQAGLTDSARAVFRRAQANAEPNLVTHYVRAFAYLRLGQTDSAVASLARFLEAAPGSREYLSRDRAWEELRDDPAFQELVAER